MKKHTLTMLALAVLTVAPQSVTAQKNVTHIDPTAQRVSYAGHTLVTADRDGSKDNSPIRMHSRQSSNSSNRLLPKLEQYRVSMNNLLERHAPVTVTSEVLQRAKARKVRDRAPFIPDNNHKHLIVNVIYNSLDATKESGLFALDVETGELTCLVDEFEHDGFNGGGYIWNGHYRGVYYEQGTTVSSSKMATILEYDMSDWSLADMIDCRFMSSMAVECATLQGADGATTVMGEYWGIDNDGNLSLRYATLDENGTTTTSFGNAEKQMLAMGVTSDGRLYGVAKDGNLYKIDRQTGSETLIGHTGIDDLVDYEGHFYLQAGEIDQRDNTFYWMAEHSSKYWTELCTVNLTTGRAKVLIDFAGDVECAGMVIAPQQKQDDTPAAVSGLSVTFAALSSTGSGTFTAPTKQFDGQDLPSGTELFYHVYVNGVKQPESDNSTAPGQQVSFGIADTDIQLNAQNTVQLTVSHGTDGEESLKATAYGWVGFGIPEAPKGASLSFDEDTHTATITWEPPTKGPDAGVKGGTVDKVNYLVYRVVDGNRGALIHTSPLPDEARQTTYTLTEADMAGNLSELAFAVVACPSPTGFPLEQLASEAATTDAVFIGVGRTLPYFVDFADDYYNVRQSDFTIVDSNGDGITWGFYPPHGTLSGAAVLPNYSTEVTENDWFILPGIWFEAGKTYQFSASMHGPSASAPWAQQAEVLAGTSKKPESMTVTVVEVTGVVDYCTIEGRFSVPEDGSYFIGIHGVSMPRQWETALFNITINEAGVAIIDDAEAPAEGEMAVTPVYGVTEGEAFGVTVYYGSADISMTLPTLKQDGTPLPADQPLNVTIYANNGLMDSQLAQLSNQQPGGTLSYTAKDLPSGEYIFSVRASYTDANGTTHNGKAFSAPAYVGWDNGVADPTGMRAIQSADKLTVILPEMTEVRGSHGAYLPSIEYWMYNGDKASTISRNLQGGNTQIFSMIEPDAIAEGNTLDINKISPQEGEQYFWHGYIVAVSTDVDGNIIFSDLLPVSTVIGKADEAPVVETGEQTFLFDGDMSLELNKTWNYYINRGVAICSIGAIDDQFGHDTGKSWDVSSAFAGDIIAVLRKVDIASLDNPVFDMELIMEDPMTGMKVILNGPDGKQAVHPMTVRDGIQQVSIDLSPYKSWGWVQPTLQSEFYMAEADEYHDIYFDNMTVYDALPLNLAIIDFEVPDELKSGEEAMANVTIMNMGQQAVADYTVSLAEDDVTVQSETISRPLAPHDIRVVQFRYHANTVSIYDRVGQDDAEKVLVATVNAVGDALETDDAAEAVVTISVEGGKQNSSPTNVMASQTEGAGDVSVTWDFDFDETTQIVTESFEDYSLWSVGGVKAGAPQGQIGAWRVYDGDNLPTYTWQDFEYINPYAGEPMAFQVFTGEVFNSNYYDYDMTATSGSQYLVSMDPADGNYIPKGDDWLISPLVRGGSTVQFNYGSLVSGRQTVELYYSETGQNIADFKLLKRLDDASGAEWYFGYAELPQTARHFAIRHGNGSYMGYGMKIDDIKYARIAGIDHFRIYVDGVQAGTSAEAAYTISQDLETGVHQIAVTAVYADGTESVPAYATLDYTATGIQSIDNGQQRADNGQQRADGAAIYSLDGKLVRRKATSTSGLHGIHVTGGRSILLK